ncbi:biotin transporter BioY [Streptomyces sp. WAC 00631]|uniref:biotin transporter BioY n=1 Tax=unclassified Streptomyces TaxID=2593676 RepID=UPI000F77A8CA|nr:MULTISPECIES: biotin transporter BioY [unclassified Streptomyces]MCC5036559.1 biotin transporter BioY [Streptomyces sp. WAC 00631]MCC9738296.1 biotin transporter BioY [Streptomyces sp. MNU89]
MSSVAHAIPRRGTLADSVWARSRVRDAVLVLGAAGLTALAAQISVPVPGSPVPVTLQTFAVLVTAAALGAKRGALGQLLYLAIGAAGLPVFSGATGGLSTVLGATGGYLLGFVVAGYLVGALAQRGADRRIAGTLLAYLAGSAAIYAVGVPVLAAVTHQPLGWAVLHGLVPFLVGDVLKAVAASAALPAAWRVMGRRR